MRIAAAPPPILFLPGATHAEFPMPPLYCWHFGRGMPHIRSAIWRPESTSRNPSPALPTKPLHDRNEDLEEIC